MTIQKIKGGELAATEKSIASCNACGRLRAYCREIAQEKRKAFRDEPYWGKPVSGFGDPKARLLIVGLAPAAHGANRTGRMFTGDRSGEWLYRALFEHGFANQAESRARDDGLTLRDVYVTAVVKCAPPDNKPRPEEILACRSHLEKELRLLPNARVILALGKIALDGVWPLLTAEGPNSGDRKPVFKHGAVHRLSDGRHLVLSYHPSQQNTFTGRLTKPMFDQVFSAAKKLLQ